MSLASCEQMEGRAPRTGLIKRLQFVTTLLTIVVCEILILHSSGVFLTAGHNLVEGSNSEHISPLQDLLDKGLTLATDIPTEILDKYSQTWKRIHRLSTLEIKTVVIAETIVPYENRDLLSLYVKEFLHASDVMTEAQKKEVLTMVDSTPLEGWVNKVETGQQGTLRNSAVMAVVKKHAKNIHFMLIGVRAEPRLGWKSIGVSCWERNEWNIVLSRVLAEKIGKEAQNFLWRSNEVSDQS